MITKYINKVAVGVITLVFPLSSLLFISCDDMFTPADENTRQEDAMYEESEYAHGLLMYGYDRLPYLTTSTTDIATDDAVTNLTNSAYLNMATGTWASDNNPMSVWDNCKDGIQYINKFQRDFENLRKAEAVAAFDHGFNGFPRDKLLHNI